MSAKTIKPEPRRRWFYSPLSGLRFSLYEDRHYWRRNHLVAYTEDQIAMFKVKKEWVEETPWQPIVEPLKVERPSPIKTKKPLPGQKGLFDD